MQNVIKHQHPCYWHKDFKDILMTYLSSFPSSSENLDDANSGEHLTCQFCLFHRDEYVYVTGLSDFC